MVSFSWNPIGSDNHGISFLNSYSYRLRKYQRSPSFCLDLSKPLVNHGGKPKKSPSTQNVAKNHISSWWPVTFSWLPTVQLPRSISPPTRPWSSPLLPDILVPIQSQRRIKHHVDPWAMVATSQDLRCDRYTSGTQPKTHTKKNRASSRWHYDCLFTTCC